MIPTQAELNGRVLYTVLAETTADGAVHTAYVGSDRDQALSVARRVPGAVLLGCLIEYDAREAGEE